MFPTQSQQSGRGKRVDSVAEIDKVLRLMADDLAPGAMGVGSRCIDEADIQALANDEAEMIANAVPRRRREFASGRALLHQLSGSSAPILVCSNRSPQLPAGWKGSLAHDATFAVAALSCDGAIRSIGIDLEPITALSTETTQVILRPDDPHMDAHLAFTLKEATYKTWSLGGGQMLEHHDVRLRISGSSFEADVMLNGALFHGRFGAASGCWLALVVDFWASDTSYTTGG